MERFLNLLYLTAVSPTFLTFVLGFLIFIVVPAVGILMLLYARFGDGDE